MSTRQPVHLKRPLMSRELARYEGIRRRLSLSCHGKTGKPTMTSAPDFRNTDSMKKYSDSHMLWRISEGVPYSTMGPFKEKLSEDEIWKLIVFVSTLGMDGFQYDPEIKDWVPTG